MNKKLYKISVEIITRCESEEEAIELGAKLNDVLNRNHMTTYIDVKEVEKVNDSK